MAVEIEVDPHHAEASTGAPAEEVTQAPELELAVAPLGWTPEQAGQFICSLWNIGCIIYGPGWAADPRETAGWDTYCAQLLDQVLPRGMGGAVELGVGLVMIGNGLAMMTMRRWPIIKAGPKPIWVREQPAQTQEQSPTPPQTPAPTPPAERKSGPYRIPQIDHNGTPENQDWGV